MSRILVVDDDPDILLTLDATLSAEGHEVVTCDRPARVAQMVAEQPFAAMIIDLSMPELSGFDVLQKLRQEEIAPPTLILSASGERADRLRGLREGADDYVVKPFDPEELVLRLERLIQAGAPRPGEISSDLGTYPCWDLLQMLERGRLSGWLTVETAQGIFHAEFCQGRARSATLGHLEDDEALIALLGLNDGRFRFIKRRDETVLEPFPTLTPSQDLLLRTAWLNDELNRVATFLPAPQDSLELTPQASRALPEDELDTLPFEEVLGHVQTHPEASLETLKRHIKTAPRRLDLTVAKLVVQGLLRRAEVAASGPKPESSLIERTDLAAQLLLSRARAADRFSDAFTLLLLAQTSAWERLLRLLGDLPDTYAHGEWQRLKQKLARTQGGTCTLREAPGKLNLHIQVLNHSTYKKAERILPLCHAVVVWMDRGKTLEDLEQLIQKVEDSPRATYGRLIAETSVEADRLAAELIKHPQWSVQAPPPADLAALLEPLR